MADLEKKLILDIFEMLEIALSELKLTLVLYCMVLNHYKKSNGIDNSMNSM